MKRFHLGVLVVTLLLLAGGLIGYTVFVNGLFPVATVNGDVIVFKTVKDNAEVSERLYSSGLAGDESIGKIFEGSQEDIFYNVFESLIVTAIIKTSVSDEIHKLASARVDSVLAGTDLNSLRDSLTRVHGWSLNTFRERILEPQALEEMLKEEHGTDYNEWLSQARASAKVQVWFLPFEWKEGALRKK